MIKRFLFACLIVLSCANTSAYPVAKQPHVITTIRTPMTTQPIPPNGDSMRGMFVWNDVVTTPAAQTQLLNFCLAKNVNVVYVAMYQFLALANSTPTHVQQ